MPIYEYACDECDHRFDRLQSFRDDPVEVCPECGKSSCRRLISAPGIVFKGSGWYIKDSKSASKNMGVAPRTDSSTSDSASSDGGDSGKKADSGGGDATSSSESKPSAGSKDNKKADA
jgi:putative FmdB family regulatory protein